MAEDIAAGKLPRAWTKSRRETENCQRASNAKSRGWTVQEEMRGILGRVSARAAGRFSILPILER